MSDTLQDCTRLVTSLVAQKGVSPPPDAVIRQNIDSALDSVKLVLMNRGVSGVKCWQDIDLTPLVGVGNELTDNSTPALPISLIEPRELWERASVGATWNRMSFAATGHLPMNVTLPNNRLVWWDWSASGTTGQPGRAIRFIQIYPVTIRLHFVGRIGSLAYANDSLGLPDLKNAVCYLAAATIVGGDEFYQARAHADLDAVTNIDCHLAQQRPIRRKRRRFGIPSWRY